DTCRNGWKSIRDSYRYVERVAKSGSAGGVPIEGPVSSDSVHWRFAPHMEFQPYLSSQRLRRTRRKKRAASLQLNMSWEYWKSSPIMRSLHR
ncbi:Hypothetical predicted protein, partial [Drosophila guanche]